MPECVFPYTHMHVSLYTIAQRVDLCCLLNIAKNTTALSHLGKQVIAISIIYSDIQWSGPQTILTSRLTEINAAAHKQAHPPPPPPIPFSRLHQSFLLSSLNHHFSSPLFQPSLSSSFNSHFLPYSFFYISISFLFQPRTQL